MPFLRNFAVLAVLFLLSTVGHGQTRLEQATEVQQYFQFKRTGLTLPMTPDEVLLALDTEGPNGENLLDQGTLFAGNQLKLNAMNNANWVAVPDIDVERVFRFIFALYGIPLPSITWEDVAQGIADLLANQPEFSDALPYTQALHQLQSILGPFNSMLNAYSIINDFVQHFQPVHVNYILNQAWSAGWDSEEAQHYLEMQTGEINYFAQHGMNFVQWGMNLMAQRNELAQCANGNALSYRQIAQKYIDGFVDFNIGFDRTAAPAHLIINNITARAPLGQAISNIQFTVNGQNYASNPSGQLMFWTSQQVTVTITATNSLGGFVSKTLTTSLYQDYFQVDVDRDNFRATLTFPNNPDITVRSVNPGFGSSDLVAPVPGGTLDVQFPVNQFQSYTVSVTSTTSQGNVMSSTRVVNFSSNPLTYPSTYTCYPGEVYDQGDSPVRFYGDLIVPAGVTLKVRSGAVLQFASGRGIKVYGNLVVEAAAPAMQRAYFTAMNDNSPSPLGGTDESGGTQWAGIQVMQEGTGSFRYSTIRHAQTAISGASNVSSVNISSSHNGVILRLPGSLTGSVISASYPVGGDSSTGQNSIVISGNNFMDASINALYGPESNPLRLTLTNNQRLQGVRVSGSIGAISFSGNSGANSEPCELGFGYYNLAKIVAPLTLHKEANQRIRVGMHGYGTTFIIAPGGSLTLQDGLPLQFHGSSILTLDGGTITGGVLTGAYDESSYGGDDNGGGWQGVRSTGQDVSNLTIRHAVTAIMGASSVSNCNIYDSYYGVMLKLPGSITGCVLTSCAVQGDSSTGQNSIVISGNDFVNGGINALFGSDPNPLRLTLTNNQKLARVGLAGTIKSLVFSGNTGTNTEPCVLNLCRYEHTRIEGAISLGKEPNQRVVAHPSGNTGPIGGTLTIASGGSLTLQNGLPLQCSDTAGITLEGGTITGGVLTSRSDESGYGGNDNGGGWLGVRSTQPSFMESTTIRSSSYAFRSQAGGDVLRNVRFLTTYGLQNQGSNPVDARMCWWGHDLGPSLMSPQPNRGAVVSGNVLYDPWIGAPSRERTPIKITYGGYVGNPATIPVTVEVTVGGAPTIYTVILDSQGRGTLPALVPSGARVRVRASHWLSADASSSKGRQITSIEATLINGDLNGDDRIDDADLGLIGYPNSNMGSRFPNSFDVNGDDSVDGVDREIVHRHLGMVGAGLLP